MKTNLLISTKMTLLVMFFLLPVMEFTGFGAWAQSVVITTTNNKCLNGGIVNVDSATTGLGATPEFQVRKDGVLVFPDPGNSALFSTATSFTGLVDGNYVVVGRAAPGNPTYSSNSIAVDDGYVNFVASTSIKSTPCDGGTAVLTTNVTSGGVKPLTFSIALQSSPGVAIQTTSGINANTFAFNALPSGNYVVSVTDSCGQTIVGATSITLATTTLSDLYLSEVYPYGLNCTNFKIANSNFRYSNGALLSAADGANFTAKLLFQGQLYGIDTNSDGSFDLGTAGFPVTPHTYLLGGYPTGVTKAQILADLANTKIVIYDQCGNSRVFPFMNYNTTYSGIRLSNCGGTVLIRSSVNTGIDCFPVTLTFTNAANPADVSSYTTTVANEVMSSTLTPGATYNVTAVDALGYTIEYLYTPGSNVQVAPASSAYAISQNSSQFNANLNVLGYGQVHV